MHRGLREEPKVGAGRAPKRAPCGLTGVPGPQDTPNSKPLESGPGTIHAFFPSSQDFGVGGQSYSEFLTSTPEGEHQEPGISRIS